MFESFPIILQVQLMILAVQEAITFFLCNVTKLGSACYCAFNFFLSLFCFNSPPT